MNKQELRKLYLKKRSVLSPEEVSLMSKAICNRLFHTLDFTKIDSVHLFLPIKQKSEINTWLICDTLRKQFPEIKIIVPKMEGNELLAYEITRETVFKENVWGIPEPVNAELFISYHIDLVLMPLLAFDLQGNRIGYGKGFYDRFLLSCKKGVIKTGLSFFEAEEEISTEVFDIPLTYCVTPNRFYSFI